MAWVVRYDIATDVLYQSYKTDADLERELDHYRKMGIPAWMHPTYQLADSKFPRYPVRQ